MHAALSPSAPLPPDLAELVRSELETGERVRWTGQPIPSAYARGAWPISLFGLMFSGGAMVWIVMAAGITAHVPVPANGPNWLPRLFPLFGLPFVLVGLGLLSVPLIARRRARGIVYAITDRRAIVFGYGFLGTREVRSYGPERLTKLVRNERRSGAGDLVFEEQMSYSSGNGQTHQRTRQIGFMGVPAVREVERLVRETLVQAAPVPERH